MKRYVFFHDSKWTEEAIYNILDNALKYTESGGSIHIEVQKQELFYKKSVFQILKRNCARKTGGDFYTIYREPEVHDQPGVELDSILQENNRTAKRIYRGSIRIGNGSCFCLIFSSEKTNETFITIMRSFENEISL